MKLLSSLRFFSIAIAAACVLSAPVNAQDAAKPEAKAETKKDAAKKNEPVYHHWTGKIDKLDAAKLQLSLTHGKGEKAKTEQITWTDRTEVKNVEATVDAKTLAVGQKVLVNVRDDQGKFIATSIVINPPKKDAKKGGEKAAAPEAKKKP